MTAEEMIDGAIAAYESGEWEEWLAWLSERGVRVGVPEFQMEYQLETSGWYHEMTPSLLASAGSFTTTANICPTGRVVWVDLR